jgi:uncharacterized protein
MNPAPRHAALSDKELDELDDFLLYAGVEDSMTLDMLDGYLHALAVGPTEVPAARWMPRVWGEDFSDMTPRTKDPRRMRRIVGLIERLAHDIAARLEDPDGPFIVPLWSTFQDHGVERDDAQIWACGFIAGIKLCEADWEPLLANEQGQAWLRPMRLLGDEDFAPEQQALTATLAAREQLSLQIPEAVLAMHEYWLAQQD